MDYKKVVGSQIVAARGLLDFSQDDLARVAGLSVLTVKRIEAVKRSPLPGGKAENSSQRIVAAIEALGIEFTNGRAPGVRYRGKFTSAERTKAAATMVRLMSEATPARKGSKQ